MFSSLTAIGGRQRTSCLRYWGGMLPTSVCLFGSDKTMCECARRMWGKRPAQTDSRPDYRLHAQRPSPCVFRPPPSRSSRVGNSSKPRWFCIHTITALLYEFQRYLKSALCSSFRQADTQGRRRTTVRPQTRHVLAGRVIQDSFDTNLPPRY